MSQNSPFGTSFRFCILVGICKTWVCCPEPMRNVTEEFFFHLSHFRWYSFYTLPLLLFFIWIRSYLAEANLLKPLQPVISVTNLSGPVNTDSATCAKAHGRHALESLCPVRYFPTVLGPPVFIPVSLLGHAHGSLPRSSLTAASNQWALLPYGITRLYLAPTLDYSRNNLQPVGT